MNIQEKLTYFSVDKAFGCLTRPALEYYIFELQRNAYAILLDLNGMHKLNKIHGYQNKIGERGSDLSLIPKIFLSHPIIKDSML